MKVKIIRNGIIPFRGFSAVTLWPLIFCRRKMNETDLNHELIHCEQQLEMMILPYYLWYVTEWLVRLVLYRNFREAYRNISFEQEAYLNQPSRWYISGRQHFSWLKYISRKSFKLS